MCRPFTLHVHALSRSYTLFDSGLPLPPPRTETITHDIKPHIARLRQTTTPTHSATSSRREPAARHRRLARLRMHVQCTSSPIKHPQTRKSPLPYKTGSHRLHSIGNQVRRRAVSAPLAHPEPSAPLALQEPSAHSARLPLAPRAEPCKTGTLPEQSWEIQSSSRKTGR